MTYSLSLLEVALSCLVLWLLLSVVNSVNDMYLPLVANWVDDVLFSIVVDSGVDLLAFFLTAS